MSAITDHAIAIFADAGVVAHRLDVLPDALDELAVRAEAVGAGPVIDEWIAKRPKRQRQRRRWLARGRP